MSNFTIDIHCHPDLQPFGKSFSTDKPGENSANRKDKNSVWFYDPPTAIDRFAQRIAGFQNIRKAILAVLLMVM